MDRRDVTAARDLLAELTGQPIRWLRPPYGALSASTLTAARATGLQPVLWTSWGRDWREGATPESVVEDVTATLVPGATVLLHDSDCTSARGSWKSTLAALPVLARAVAGERPRGRAAPGARGGDGPGLP